MFATVLARRSCLARCVFARALILVGGCRSLDPEPRPLVSPATDPVAFERPSCGADGTVYETASSLRAADAEPPRLIGGGIVALQSQLRYPESARKVRAQGRIVVRFVVDERGLPTAPEVVESPHPDLAREVLRVLHTATFEPARVAGAPVCARMSMPMSFAHLGTRYLN